MAAPHQTIPALTGLRFPAALAVAVSHLPYLGSVALLPTWLRKALPEGHAGVPFFFCLSGFVLTHAYADRPRGRAYLLARAARVWPLHLLTLAAAAAWPMDDLPRAAWQYLTEAALVHFWSPDPLTRRGVNPVDWSLSVEASLYLTLPALLAATRGLDRRPPAFWLAAAGGLAAAQIGLMSAAVAWSPAAADAILQSPPPHLFVFAVGVAAAKAWAGLRSRGWVGRPAGRLGRAAATAGEAAAVAALAACVLFHGKVSPALRVGGFYTPAVGLVVLVFALGRGRLSGAMAARPVRFLGEVSFAFYLVHCLVFFHAGHALLAAAGPVPTAFVSLAAAAAVAVVLHVGFEAPARVWLLGRRGDRRPNSSAASAAC